MNLSSMEGKIFGIPVVILFIIGSLALLIDVPVYLFHNTQMAELGQVNQTQTQLEQRLNHLKEASPTAVVVSPTPSPSAKARFVPQQTSVASPEGIPAK